MSCSCWAPKLTMIFITNSKQQANCRADLFPPSHYLKFMEMQTLLETQPGRNHSLLFCFPTCREKKVRQKSDFSAGYFTELPSWCVLNPFFFFLHFPLGYVNGINNSLRIYLSLMQILSTRKTIEKNVCLIFQSLEKTQWWSKLYCYHCLVIRHGELFQCLNSYISAQSFSFLQTSLFYNKTFVWKKLWANESNCTCLQITTKCDFVYIYNIHIYMKLL